MDRVKISACYIAKNEGVNIEKSLHSIKDIADEIIFIDTGSTDNTIAIAEKYGAKVYSLPWQDDFSAPRNFALAKANGDWIIFIDADEYFPLACCKQLKRIIAEQFRQGYDGALLIRRYDIDVDKNNDVLADTLVSRVYASKKNRRYRGLVHEELLDDGKPIQKQIIIPPTQVKLMHTGYSARMTEHKARRNLALLERELALGTNPGRLYMYLADVYLGLGEDDKAWHYAWLDVKQGRRPTTYASRSYRILLELSLKGKTDLRGRLELCQLAVRDYPENPEFRADLAECLATLGRYKEAADMMARTIQAYENYQGMEPMLMTAEVAKIAADRGKIFAALAEQQKEIMGLLVTALCAMRNEEYWHTETKNILAPAYRQILDYYHEGKITIDDWESLSTCYVECVKFLLDNHGEVWLEKLLSLLNYFSVSTRQQILSLLDKQIQREEGTAS